MNKLLMITAIHKEYWLPDDKMYLPVQVGNGESLGIIRDNAGDNIAEKNANYCELTAMYWAYKNLKMYDYIGFDHYRRHFANGYIGTKKSRVAGFKDIEKYLREDVVLLPKARNYRIETNYSQYSHAHNEVDLIKTREVIGDLYPEYVKAFDSYMTQTIGHRFNMMIMSKAIFLDYSKWLFDILFEIEKRLDISTYSDYDKRVFGFISERLLDVYLSQNKISYIELPYVYMDMENWVMKIYKFMQRKLRNV